jgi:uncharacterized spore protein YtfJ
VELNRLFDTMDRVQENATVEAVFGLPVKVDEKTVIPIGRVAYGFGLGFGEGTATTPSPEAEESAESEVAGGSGGGGGGGLSVRPLAVLEVTAEATTVKPIIDEDKISKMVTCVIGWSVFWLAKALIKIFGKG